MNNSTLSRTLKTLVDLYLSDIPTQYSSNTLYPEGEVTVGSGSFERLEEAPTQTFSTDNCLGKGGMGNIQLGKQNIPEREVAIKTLLKDTPQTRQILLQEANIMGKLEHPNIVPIHEVHINDENDIQIIMKRIQGKTLGDFLVKENSDETQIREGLNVLIQVCHALEFAHSHNILHRDIKCENIMVGKFNEVYLMDWGLAFDITLAHTVNTGIMGTPGYMAPEMLHGDPTELDIRTDVYLLGSTLHYILMGRHRHDAENICSTLALVEASLSFEYPASIPRHIGAIANRACAQDPDDRYENVFIFRAELENALRIWDAIKICSRANRKIIQLNRLIQKKRSTEEDINTIHEKFIEVLSTLKTALEISPTYQEAQEDIDRLNLLMIDFYLSQQKPKEAQALYKNLPEEDLKLERKINKQLAYVIDVEKAQKVASERDPLRSKSGRKMLLYSFTAGMMGLVTFGFLYQWIYQPEITPKRLLFSTTALFFTILGGVFLGRKTLMSNELGRELTKTMVLGSVAAVTNTLAGFLYDISSGLIMTIDMFLLGLTFGATNAVLKSGNRIMINSFSFGTFALFFRDQVEIIHTIILVSMGISGMLALSDLYKENEE